MLILALDLKDREKALSVAESVKEHVDVIKVNYPLVLSCGVEIIGELSEIRPVIADFKIADIPFTSSAIAEIAFESGARAVICHGFVGRDVVEEVVKVAKRYSGEVYVVAELSSEGAREFMQPVAEKIVEIANNVGCHGIIAPATRPERVEKLRRLARGLKIISPGVGAQGGKVEEIAKFVDGIIVGRSIYGAENPVEAAKRFKEAFLRAKNIL